jgi:hypothetical protein
VSRDGDGPEILRFNLTHRRPAEMATDDTTTRDDPRAETAADEHGTDEAIE